MGTGTRIERGGEEKGSSCIRYIRKEAEHKTRHCHSVSGIISVDRKWRLQVASSFGRKTCPTMWFPRGEQGTRDER